MRRRPGYAVRPLAGAGGPVEPLNFTEDLLDKALAEAHLAPPDRRLCQELVYGVVRWQATLDWLIARKTAGRPQKSALQELLRLGLYQIFWLDRIPNHAAVNETVESARHFGFGPQSGFVNAVLRGYLREADATEKLLAELKKTEPHLGYSHPAWLVARWQQRWKPEQAAALMEWDNAPPGTFARVNTLKTDPGALIEQWRNENVEYDFIRRDWLGESSVFILKSHPHLTTLPSFRDGLFYVQDPSTLLAVRELGPLPGERILDYCAAPGGKLTAAAALMRNEGELFAHDVGKERLRFIDENCARLGVTCVRKIPAAWPVLPEFDRILVDAPCSNTGVMGRRVDLRWRIREDEIARLRGEQLGLLLDAARRVKPRGVLWYSTCSLEPEENQSVVTDFLAQSPAFRLERDRLLTPFTDAVDGAYVARLVRA